MSKLKFLLIFAVALCGAGILAATNTVKAEEAKPDLTITAVDYAVSEVNISGEDKIKIAFNIKYENNGGSEITDPFYVSYNCGSNSDLVGGVIIEQKIEINHEYGISVNRYQPIDYSIDANCNFYIDKYIPYESIKDNLIEESNENNNTFEKTVTVGVKPDFIVSQVGVKYFSEGNYGNYYYATVKNIGGNLIFNGNTDSRILGINFYGNAGWVGGSDELVYYTKKQYAVGDEIKSNQEIELVGPSTNQASAGTYTIKALVNPIPQYIEEGNYINNTLEKTVNIATTKPDLTVKDVYFSPANPLQNQVYNGELHVKVANIGKGATNSRNGVGIRVAVALSSSYTLQNWNSDGVKTINDMAGDSTVDVVFPIKYTKFTSAPLEIRVWLDSNAITSGNNNDNLDINESNENNNFFEKKIVLENGTISSGDLLNIKLDKVALDKDEIESNSKITNLDYHNSDPEVTNSGSAKPSEYIQQTIQSNNYNQDGQYYTTGLRSYGSVEDAKKIFNYQNTSHTRKVISLSDAEKLGDGTFCHVVEPGYNGINNKNQQGQLMYYFICGFRYKNLYIDTQAMLNENNYSRVFNNLKEYYANVINYDKNRIPYIPGLTPEEVQDSQIVKINQNAKDIIDDKYDSILSELKQLRDIVKEQASKIKYFEKLSKDVEKLSAKMENAINNFITYGVDSNTQKLGEGERAAVMYSYKNAFDKLPETEAELADAIKIANGRWPSITNDEAEKTAKEQFQKIYHRIADMNNANDNAAVTVMAYGLRQKAENRNLNSEKQGIKTFKNIYGHTPNTTEEWNIMQAITYSGSARGVDSDGDLLTDEREAQLGTDPKNKDTDGDGFIDGIEVANGHDPLNK